MNSRYDRTDYLEYRIHELCVFSGHSLYELIDLFAKGYTLHPPKEPMTMSELAKEMEKKDEH